MNGRRIPRDFYFAGVYMIRNGTNGKAYIGSSANIVSRLHNHESKLLSGNHPCKEMQNDFDDGHHFSFDVLEAFPVHRNGDRSLVTKNQKMKLRSSEWKFIQKFDSINHGYNTVGVTEQARGSEV